MRLRTFGIVAVSALVLTAGVAIAALIFGSFGPLTQKVLATSGAVAFYTLIAMGGAAAFTPAAGRFQRGNGATAMATALIGFILTVWQVWIAGDDHSELHEKLMVSAMIISVSTAVVALIGRLDLAADREWLRRATSACVFFFGAGLIVLWIILETRHPRLERANAVAGVLASLGIVVTPLVAWFERRIARRAAAAEVLCPACGHRFTPAAATSELPAVRPA